MYNSIVLVESILKAKGRIYPSSAKSQLHMCDLVVQR